MSRNAKKFISVTKGRTLEDVNKELDNIRNFLIAFPVIYGEGSPIDEVIANKGFIYADYKNGKIYVKESDDGKNTGWVLK